MSPVSRFVLSHSFAVFRWWENVSVFLYDTSMACFSKALRLDKTKTWQQQNKIKREKKNPPADCSYFYVYHIYLYKYKWCYFLSQISKPAFCSAHRCDISFCTSLHGIPQHTHRQTEQRKLSICLFDVHTIHIYNMFIKSDIVNIVKYQLIEIMDGNCLRSLLLLLMFFLRHRKILSCGFSFWQRSLRLMKMKL